MGRGVEGRGVGIGGGERGGDRRRAEGGDRRREEGG